MITLSINNRSIAYPSTSAQEAGLAAAVKNVNDVLPPGPEQDASTPAAQRPGYISDSAAYFAGLVAPWDAINPNGISTSSTSVDGVDINGQPVTATTITTVTLNDFITEILDSWANFKWPS